MNPRQGGVPRRVGGLGAPLSVRSRTQRDEVGQRGDRVEVAERGQALEAERVEPVAGQEGQIGVLAGQHARVAEVQELALADRLEQETDLLARAGRQRLARGLGPQRVGEQAALGAQLGGQGAQRVAHGISANAAAAASSVRSTCSGPCTVETNHAS